MAYDPNVNYREVARRKALKYGLDPDIFERQIGVESIGYRPDVITGRTASPAGAQGIAQIMPATAKGWGVNPLKPRHALDAAAKNMAAYVRQYGSYERALRAYNAGPGAIEASRGYSETNNYVQQILRGRDPQKLGEPRSPGRGRSGRGDGGGGRGGPTTLSQLVSSPGAVISPPPSMLMDLLQEQPKAQVPVSAPSPMMQGADRYLRNGSPGQLPSLGAPVQAGQGGLGAQLAQLGGAPSIIVPGSSQRVSVTGSPEATDGRGPVGKTLVIGDSLQVGTFPLLKDMLGGKVKGVTVGGKSSSWGIRQLRQQFKSGRFQNVVFDMGTNDATVGELRQSLRQLTKIAGGAKVYVSTVNSPWDEGAKNRLLRTYARNHGNVELIKWHGATKGGATLADGIHGRYEQRASLLADALGYEPKTAPSGKNWGVQPRGQLLEMFYNGPGNAVNADNGKRVGKGFVDGHESHVHVAADPKTVVEIGRMAQKMGLTVRENKAFDQVDPVHTQGSFHYSNRAADISGDPKKMAALTRRVARIYGL